MSGAREYEIKAVFHPDLLPALHAHPLLVEALRAAKPAQMLATYYDTDRFDLWHAGFSLRLRKTPDGIIQTLKRAGTSSLDREEWEWPVEADRLDLDSLRQTPLASRLEALGDQLAPRFVVDVARTTFDVREAQSRIEGALDEGTIQGNGQRVLVCEVELELKHGAPQDVVSLARLLTNDLPLLPSVASKAERGFHLIAGRMDRPQKGLRVELHRGASIRITVETIVASCVRAICFHVGLMDGPQRMEAVHQTRVAVRRLRAALMLFKPKLDVAALQHVQRELKWVSSLLGAARDCDVHQSAVFDPAAEDHRAPFGSGHLAAAMRDVQADAHRALAVAFETVRWRHLLLDLIAVPLVRDEATTSSTYEAFVVARLKKRRRRVLDRAAALRDLTPDARHDVRKEAKLLRYALSFFSEDLVVHRERYRRTVKSLGIVQETLGDLHDREALRDMLREYATSPAAPIHRQAEDARIASIFAAGALTTTSIKPGAELKRAEKALKVISARNPF